MTMVILGWRFEWPLKVIYVRRYARVRDRFGWTWRGWPIRRVRVLRYAHLSKQQDD